MLRPGLFLDRDGVVNLDTGYVHKRDDFVFIDGIFDLVRAGISHGYVPVIATNQSGIARGLFPETAFHRLTDWMLRVFEAEGAPIARVYHCPYLPDAPVGRYRHPDHPWRKPAPGMLLAARDDLGLDLARSALVGDRRSDAMAGAAAGLGSIALVNPGEEPAEDPPGVRRLASVREAVGWLATLPRHAGANVRNSS